ncbi:MAG: class I SAM-dependent methyltransferase [Chitinophagaceae bacterium]
MKNTLTNKDLLKYLKRLKLKTGLIDKLKIYYRPIVCPFVELISFVKEGDRIGDIGCGSGQFCLLLAAFAKPSFIFGIEINDHLVNNAKSLFEKHSDVPYEFEKFNGKHFPEKIATLDLIFLNDVLHHVPKDFQQQFISDLVNCMKTGARLIIKDINGGSPLVYFNKIHDLVFAGEIGNELPYNKTQSWLEQNNLEIIEIKKKRMYVYPHYTIVAKK